MQADGWKELIKNAVREAEVGDFETLDMLARHLEMCDWAKQELRNKGYGCTGVDILETVKLVPKER